MFATALDIYVAQTSMLFSYAAHNPATSTFIQRTGRTDDLVPHSSKIIRAISRFPMAKKVSW